MLLHLELFFLLGGTSVELRHHLTARPTLSQPQWAPLARDFFRPPMRLAHGWRSSASPESGLMSVAPAGVRLEAAPEYLYGVPARAWIGTVAGTDLAREQRSAFATAEPPALQFVETEAKALGRQSILAEAPGAEGSQGGHPGGETVNDNDASQGDNLEEGTRETNSNLQRLIEAVGGTSCGVRGPAGAAAADPGRCPTRSRRQQRIG